MDNPTDPRLDAAREDIAAENASEKPDTDNAAGLCRTLIGDILQSGDSLDALEQQVSGLSAFGETAIKEVFQVMDLAWEPDREKLADLLVELSPGHEDIVREALEGILAGSDEDLKTAAVRTLAGIGARNERITELIGALGAPEERVRDAALKGITAIAGTDFDFNPSFSSQDGENETALQSMRNWPPEITEPEIEAEPETESEETKSADAVSIAVYNAAFDPIHNFHLWAAQHLLNEKIVDKVVFVPKGNPKGEREIAPDMDRLTMLRLATAQMDGLEVSDCELASTEPVRSFEVLQAVEKQCLETHKEISLSLIVGQETLARMPQWRIFNQLIENFNVLVVPRGRKDPERIANGTPALRKNRSSIRIVRLPFEFALSSSYIRDCVADGKSIRLLVPDTVLDYITEKGLYKTRYKSRPPYERKRKPATHTPPGPKMFHWCGPHDSVRGTKIDVSSQGAEFSSLSPFTKYGKIPVPGMDDTYADSVEGLWQGLKVIHGRIDTRFFEGRGRKRRSYGRIEGHKFGDELLDYVEARRLIYVPSYLYMVKNYCTEQVEELVKRLNSGEEIHLHDVETNPDIEDTSSPLSHAAVLVDYLNKEVMRVRPKRGGADHRNERDEDAGRKKHRRRGGAGRTRTGERSESAGRVSNKSRREKDKPEETRQTGNFPVDTDGVEEEPFDKRMPAGKTRQPSGQPNENLNEENRDTSSSNDSDDFLENVWDPENM
ncbi:MAG: nicotinate (nicotinamide) nucleotide adenylyltransferase [Planctomycetota bacterium]|nr:MAG: nicotinate (nicotinamide) nucleotide adenylyltransferase [Planctomycetota bacterium]